MTLPNLPKTKKVAVEKLSKGDKVEGWVVKGVEVWTHIVIVQYEGLSYPCTYNRGWMEDVEVDE